MLSLYFFVNRSEGASSAPVPSSQYYRPTQHHITTNSTKLSILQLTEYLPVDCLGSKRTSTQAMQGEYRDNKVRITE